MYCLSQFCCLCFRNKVKLKLLHEITCGETSFIKIANVVLPEIQLSEVSRITSACLDCVNFVTEMYTFRQNCITNNFSLVEYIELLSSLGGEIGYAQVKILDFTKEINVKDENVIVGAVKSEDFDYGHSVELYCDETAMNEIVKEEDFEIEMNDNKDNCGYKEWLDAIKLELSEERAGETANDENCDYVVSCSPRINCNETATSDSGTLKEVQACNIQAEESSGHNSGAPGKYSDADDKNSEINKQNMCKICQKSYKSKYYLQQHILIHNMSGTKFKCETCGKSFCAFNALSRHKLIHTGEKPHKCEICGKSFNCKSNLRQHILIHGQRSKHPCEICGKFYTNITILKRHKVGHSDEKPYKCEKCGKSYHFNFMLKQHILSHNCLSSKNQAVHTGENLRACKICPEKNPEPRNKFTCETCGKSYSTRYTWRDHTAIHTNKNLYQCKNCGKCFSTRSSLNNHSALSHKKKPYKCKHCGKSFNRSHRLKQHAAIHTGNKRHKCNVCQKLFLFPSHLKKHQLIHSKKNMNIT